MPVIERIVARFYEGVATDPILLRPMYPEDDLADGSAARRLTLFLAQYWGGPTTYSQERGHPRLRMRHAPFAVTPTAGEHWLRHFRAGLDEVGADPGAGREVLGLRHLCRASSCSTPRTDPRHRTDLHFPHPLPSGVRRHPERSAITAPTTARVLSSLSGP